ncbi:MAG: TRAP transporter small permease [Hyphomicrobiales bacterium]|nr:TRAP transporter small permease [Hyphomicrobiales bacterium]
MALIRVVEAVLSLIDRLVMWLVGAMLLVMTIVLFANSIGRAALNLSFVGGPALGRLLMIWLTFMGAYLLVRSGGHIAIDITKRVVSGRSWRRLEVLIGLAGGATMGYVAWLGYQFTALRFSLGQMDPMLNIPTGVFYLALPLGCGLMALSFFHNALKAFVKSAL